LEDILKSYQSEGSQEVNQQRELIIRKINSNDDTTIEESSDFEDEDDDDEEDAEMMELELDSGEALLVLNREELIGDQLLINEYSFGNLGNEPIKSNRIENEFLNDSTVINYRPITPLNLRQSQQFKNKQMTSRDSFTPEKTFQNVKNSIDHFDRSNRNHNENLKQGTLVNNRVKSGGMTQQNRSHSVEKRPPYNHSLSAGNRIGNDRSTNVLVIESNDIPVEESYSTMASTTTVAASKSFLAGDSINGNGFQRQKSFRRGTEPNNVPIQRQKTPNMNNSVNIAPNPKYSITEPRPSSANSTKSKTSSSSSTVNQESAYNNNNLKRNGAKN